MIHFVTNGNYRTEEFNTPSPLKDTPEVVIQNDKKGLKLLADFFEKQIKVDKRVGIDLETNGLDAYINKPLLNCIGNKDTQFVIDCSTVDFGDLFRYYASEVKWINHNIKFDWKFLKVHYNIDLIDMYDTMIADQRLTQNCGYLHSLDNVLYRRLGSLPYAMNKDIRMEFVGKNDMTFEERHIRYGAEDVGCLFDLKDVLDERIAKNEQEFLFYSVEFPLIRVLAKAELYGCELDVEKWKENITINKHKKFDIEISLDNEFRKLRDRWCKPKYKIYLTGGKYDRIRHKQLDEPQQDLFGNEVSLGQALQGKRKNPVKVKFNSGNINWSSTEEVTKIIALLGFELPKKNDEKGVPLFDIVKNKVVLIKDIDEKERFTTQSDFLESFLITNPKCKHRTFIELLFEHRSVSTELNNFGENFINKINPITGRIHTIYRQCNTANGRLQSGGGKNEPDKYNSQNIPRKKELRHCFKAGKGYKVLTCDLSGAEITVMADKAKDHRLLELHGKDIHSHMAQAAWRNIYLYDAGRKANVWNNPKTFWDLKSSTQITRIYNHSETARTLMEKARTFKVSKQINLDKRISGKNLTFGSVYGAGSKKAGKTINVSKDKGSIYINTIAREIPDTFKMVNRNVYLAKKQGFLTINKRTNSRIYFMPILKHFKEGYKLDWRDLRDIEGQARNVPISGTQADLLKESMVVINDKIEKENLDCHLMKQVHDELVYAFPDTEDYKWFPEYISSTMSEVANKYLDVMEMGADYEVMDSWTK